MEKEYSKIQKFLKSYIETTNCLGFCIGISGGKDSTIVAKLLVDAIGKENVLGILMPNGEQKDISDSIKVCRYLDIDYKVVNIELSYLDIIDQIQGFQTSEFYIPTEKGMLIKISDKSKTNILPRIRMITLYSIAQTIGYRVAGTSNASELFIGWGTKWGDMASDINPISELTCSDVIKLGDYMGLPEDLVHKVPADGLTGKSDEENFGFSYSDLDSLIEKQRVLISTGRIPCAYTELELKILHLHELAYHKDHVIKINQHG